MVEKRVLAKSLFEYPDHCRILEYGEVFDAMFGCSTVEVGEQEIDALKGGKVLYFNDGEYATLIRLKGAEK